MLKAKEIVEQFYSLLAVGKLPEALSLMAPEIEWTEAERTPYYAGTVIGGDAVVATVFGPISKDFKDFSATPHTFIAEGKRVAAFGKYTGVAKLTGLDLDAPFVHLWTVSDLRLTQFHQYSDSNAWFSPLR